MDLDISWNGLGNYPGDAVLGSLVSALKGNKQLRHLNLSYNFFTERECDQLAQGLLVNHTILGIHIKGNRGYINA